MDALRTQVLKMSKNIRHRGPDWSGVYCGERAIFSHERLSIVDPQSGGQPSSAATKLVLAVNGEIATIRKSATSWPGSTISDRLGLGDPAFTGKWASDCSKDQRHLRFRAVRHRNDEYLIAAIRSASSRSTSAGTATSSSTWPRA